MNIGGSLYRRPRTKYWWMKYYIPGRSEPVRESTGEESEKAAGKVLKAKLGDVAAGKIVFGGARKTSVSDLLDLFLADQVLQGRKGADKNRSRVEAHLRPYFGAFEVGAVGNLQVADYIARRREEKPKTGQGTTKNATINRELEILRRSYNLGFQHEPQLVTKVLRIPRLKEDNVREGILDHADYIRLRDSLPQHYRLLLICGYHLGARLGELCQIEWSRVDLDAREILLERTTTKNGRPRILPIYGEMIQALAEEKATQARDFPRCPWVFQRRGQRVIFRWKTWNSLVISAGLVGFKFHDLRRTAVTNMIDNRIPEKDAMEISGHTTRKMLERYHIVRRDAIHRVGETMTRALEEKTAALPGTFSGTPKNAAA